MTTITNKITINHEDVKNIKDTEIIIPEGVKVIAPKTFFNTKIKKIILPESLNTIDDWAFYFSDIETINIPINVSKIGKGAFYKCSKLKYIDFSKNLNIMEISESLFANSGLEEIILPPNILKIKRGAFYYSKIKHINIPNFVRTIEDYAFANCIDLESINLSNILEEIPSGCFSQSGLKKIDCKNVKKIRENAFCYCKNLYNIILDNVEIIAKDNFNGCPKLQSINVPKAKKISLIKNVSKIDINGDNLSFSTFTDKRYKVDLINTLLKKTDKKNKNKLHRYLSVYYNNYLEDFHDSAIFFSYITKNNMIKYQENLSLIKDDSFSDEIKAILLNNINNFSDEEKEEAERYEIEKLVTGNINEKEAKVNWNYTKECNVKGESYIKLNFSKINPEILEIPAYINNIPVKVIASYFTSSSKEQLSNVKEIILPETLESIGINSFVCLNIKSIDLKNVKTISSSFVHCKNLEKVIFSKKLENINSYTFAYCNIKELIIPNNIKTLKENAFASNYNLIKIVLPENIILEGNPFWHCKNVKEYIIPDSTIFTKLPNFKEIPIQAIKISKEKEEKIKTAAYNYLFTGIYKEETNN